MNHEEHLELSAILAELQRLYPEWRFGQLIANVADWADQSIWDVTDDQLLAAAKQNLRAIAQRKQEARA
jgi:hypothetical protein